MPRNASITGLNFHAPARPETDADQFRDICLMHSLTALNTHHGHHPTFVGPQGSSVIDYMLTRGPQATAAIPNTAVAPAPFADWRSGGKHLMLSTRLPAHVWKYKPAHKPPLRWDELTLRKAAQSCSTQHAAWRTDMSLALAQLTPAERTRTDHVVSQITARHFPRQARARAPAPWQTAEVRASVKLLWQARDALRKCQASTGLASLFTMWRHAASFAKCSRECKRVGRQARRQRLLACIQEAEQAKQRGDLRGLYQVVKRLAPKQAYRRVQLRDSTGKMLNDDESVQALLVYSRATFCKEPTSNLTEPLQAPLQISMEELTEALGQLKPNKAVPPHSAPITAYQANKSLVLPAILQYLQQAWQPGLEPLLDKSWTSGWLVWIPKPGKSPSRPENLRPLALMTTEAKLIATVLKQKLTPYVVKFLLDTPQFAYVPNRNIYHSISKVLAHCRQVRERLKAFTENLHRRHSGVCPTKQGENYGALQITLDLSKAFDSLRWGHVQRALQAADVPQPLCAAVLSLLSHTTYHLHSGEAITSLRITNGIRQGCPLSPLLWSLASGRIWQILKQHMTEQATQGITLYADDHHLGLTFHDVPTFKQAIKQAGILLEVLDTAGLSVNAQKSVALLEVRGKALKKAVKDYVAKTAQGRCFVLPHPYSPQLPPTRIPLQTTATYLGIVIAYHNFEDATLKRNIRKAQGRYQQLRKILNGHHNLTQTTRLRLWRACIEPIFYYALHTTGITKQGSHLLYTALIKQLRAIGASPVHITHESSTDLLARLGVQWFHDTMQERGNNLLQKLCLAPPEDGILQDPHIQASLQASLNTFMELNSFSPPEPEVLAFECATCGASFASNRGLKTHLRRKHGEAQVAHTLKARDHGLNGLPTCKHCKVAFPKWQVLENHVRLLACEGLRKAWRDMQTPDITLDPKDVPQSSTETYHFPTPIALKKFPQLHTFLTQPYANAWGSVFACATITTWVRQRCVFCGQWIAGPAGFRAHWRRIHEDIWSVISALTLTLQRKGATLFTPPTHQPCLACQQTVRKPLLHTPACAVITQVVALQLLVQPESVHLPCHASHGVRSLTLRRRAGGHMGGPFSSHAADPTGVVSDTGAEAPARTGGVSAHTPTPARTARGVWDGSAESPASPHRLTHGDQSHDSQALAPAGGFPANDTGRPWFCSSPGRDSGKQHPRRPDPEIPPMACSTSAWQTDQLEWHRPIGRGQRFHQSLGDANPAALTLDAMFGKRTAGQTADLHTDQRPSDEGPGHGTLQGGTVDHVALGPRPAENGAGPVSSQGHYRTDAPASSRPTRVPRGPHSCPSLSLPAEMGNRAEATQDSDALRSEPSKEPGSQPPFGSLRTSSSHYDRRGPEAGGPTPQPDGAAPLQNGGTVRARNGPDGPSLVRDTPPDSIPLFQAYPTLQIPLHNPHNLCYLNSVTLASLWTSRAHVTPQQQPLWEVCNSLVAQSHPCKLALVIRPLLRYWKHIRSQHDAAEFYAFLAPQLLATLCEGDWQARRHALPHAEVTDLGSTVQPVSLYPSLTETTLQALVNKWHTQAHRHALRKAPEILTLRIPKFTRPGHPAALAVRYDLLNTECVQMPCYTRSDCTTELVSYELTACVLHVGDTPRAGHYTTLLRVGQGEWQLHDDARDIIICTQQRASQLAGEQGYVILLRKASS